VPTMSAWYCCPLHSNGLSHSGTVVGLAETGDAGGSVA
jgi:hypothetical protein